MNIFGLRSINLNKPITTIKIRRQTLTTMCPMCLPSMPAVNILLL